MDRDSEHLHILSIIYYVVAGLSLIGMCCGGFYAGFGFLALAAPQAFNAPQSPYGMQHPPPGQPPPEFFGYMFGGFGCAIILISLTAAILLFFAGRSLAKHKHHTYCLVIAGLCCTSVPLGTVLGVFSFIVLLRPSVKELFKTEKLVST